MRFLLSTKQTLFKGKLGSEIKASVRHKGYRLSSDLNNQKIINLLEEAIKERLAVKQLKLERRLDLIKLQHDLETKFDQEETSDKTFLKLKEYITTVFLANQTFLIASPENITLRQELQPLLFEDNSFRIDFEKETGDILIWIASKEYPRGFLKALKKDAEKTNGEKQRF